MNNRDSLRTLADIIEKSQEYIELEIPSAAISILRAMDMFPQFEDDFKILWHNKIIELEDGFFKWNYTKTSLAEYFINLENVSEIKFFWENIESAFLLEEGSLRHLASSNGRGDPPPSKDYIKIKDLLKSHREHTNNQKKLNAIINMILNINPDNNDEMTKLFDDIKKIL